VGHRHLLAACAAELVGTAVLVGVGLSVVIVASAPHGPLASVLPSLAARRALTGGLFGAVGMTVTLSPVGRVSGAHLNPAVSFAFWCEGTLPGAALLGYVAAQLTGAVLGALPLLAFGSLGQQVAYGATMPGPAGIGPAYLGETLTTFVLVATVVVFVAHPRLRAWTPCTLPPMYGLMVWLEAAYSGTSTNPARSLGPAVVSGQWHAYWLYWAAPLTGSLLAVAARHLVPGLKELEVEVARVAHFEARRPWPPPRR
jgi:aquaporin Z